MGTVTKLTITALSALIPLALIPSASAMTAPPSTSASSGVLTPRISPPLGWSCRGDIKATGSKPTGVVHVANIYAGPGVTGRLTLSKTRSTSFTIGLAVNYNGAGYQVASGATSTVTIRDGAQLANTRAAVYRTISFVEYAGTCRNDPALEFAPTKWVVPTSTIGGWTTQAVRTPPKGFPNCATMSKEADTPQRGESEARRFWYGAGVNFSKEITETVVSSVTLSVGVSVGVELSEGTGMELSYSASKPGWICKGDNQPLDAPDNWQIAGWVKR